MKFIAAAIALTLIAGQATALSCMRPDPVGTFERIEADPASYYILYGTLEFDATKQPKGVVNKERNPRPIPAQFSGHGLNTNGFTSAYNNPVTLQPTCAGPWCGSQTPGVKSVFFAKLVGDQVVIEASACGGTIFAEPSPDVLDAMTACINGNCP